MKLFLVMGVGLCVATGFANADTTEVNSDNAVEFNSKISFGAMEERIEIEDSGGWYFVPRVGVNLISDQSYGGVTIPYDAGISFGLGVGKNLSDNFSLQFDIGFTKNDVDPVTFDAEKWWPSTVADLATHSGYVSQLPIMVSGIFDLGGDSIRPYIGAGAGMTRTRIKNLQSSAGWSGQGRDSDTDMGFSYQFLAGVKLELSPTSNMHVGYRYLSEDSDYWKGDFENHTISLGLHFRF